VLARVEHVRRFAIRELSLARPDDRNLRVCGAHEWLDENQQREHRP
jgi:hypothetical protein